MKSRQAVVLAPRRAKLLFWSVLGIYCLLAAGTFILGLRHSALWLFLFGSLIERIYRLLQKWRLQRYGEEIKQRIQTTDDPRLKEK